MALEHAILGFLSRESMTGYDLKTRCFDSAAGHLWTADQAQIYRSLEKLAARGLVRSRLVPQRGKPDRKVYSITSKGRTELSAWLLRPEDPPNVRDPFLLHLFFAPDLPDDEIVGLLAHAREEYQRRLDHLRLEDRDTLPEWERSTGRSRDAALRRMTVAAGISAARTAIDWIDDCIDRVHAGLPAPAPIEHPTAEPTT
ncbi:MAG TPA: PadR family transcriptional regulator [Coriobacteriia bacterium]